MDKKHPLAVWRENQNPKLTQEEFGVLIGVTKWTVNSIEVGRRKPSTKLVSQIMKATGNDVGFDELVGVAA